MFSSHLSGRNNSASVPYRSGPRCIVYTLKATALPLGMRTGDPRSGPPPVGSTVVLVAVRVLTGTEGYSRRAGLKASISSEKNLELNRTFFENVLQIRHLSQAIAAKFRICVTGRTDLLT